MRWVAGVAVVVALAAACTNPDTPTGEGWERRGGGGAESADLAEVVRGGEAREDAVEPPRRVPAPAERDAAAVSDAEDGSAAPDGDRDEVPEVVEHSDPGEEAAAVDALPVFVELAGLVEAVVDASRLSGLLWVGSSAWCGLRADGSVACLRSHDGELPEGGPFVAITNGVGFGCGLRPDGTVECWGSGAPDVPGCVFTAIGSGRYRSCGLRPGGGLACWARRPEDLSVSFSDAFGLDLPLPEEFLAWATLHPGGVFGAVSVGFGHVCGLRADGSVECWGEDWFGQSSQAPPGAFVAVDAGVSHSCGLRPDGSAECWGEDSMDSGRLGTMEYRYEGGEEAFLDRDGPRVQEGSPRELDFMTIEGGLFDAALIGEMVRRAGGWEPPRGPFKAVSAGVGFTCGLGLDGEVDCWGYVANEEPRIPLAVYAEVVGERVRELYAAARAEVDGAEPEGALSQEAGAEHGGDTTGGGPDAEVVAAAARAAGVDSATFALILGYVDLVNPPPGPFVAIDAGSWRACGLRFDGEVACWGFDYEGFFDYLGLSLSPPAGPFATEALPLRIVNGSIDDGTVGGADSAAGVVSGDVGGVEGSGDFGGVWEGVIFAFLLERSGPSCGGVLVPGGRLESLVHPESPGRRFGYGGPWVPGGQVELVTLWLRPNWPVRLSVVGGRVPRGGESMEDGTGLVMDLPAVKADPEGFLSTTWQIPEAPAGHDGPMWYQVRAEGELMLTHQKLDAIVEPLIVVYPEAPPCAVSDEATTTVDRPVRVDVLADDIAPTGGTLDPATVTVTDAWKGEFVTDPADGSLTFTPEPGFVGTAHGAYIVYDSWNVGAPAPVTVTVKRR